MLNMFKIKLQSGFIHGGVITQLFGRTQFAIDHPSYYRYGVHTGLDFAAPLGSPIFAPHDGQIILLDDIDDSGTGKKISLWNERKRFATRYYHLDDIAVTLLQKVKKGDIIAFVGNTGLSTGPHTHFEVVKTDKNGYVINKDNGAGGAIDPNGEKILWK